MRVGALAAVLLALVAPTVTAQHLSFEAASIKTSDPREGIDVRFLPERLMATNVTLDQLIEQAYGLEPRELVGVTATTGDVAGKPEMMLMLQQLLADRFELELAQETRTGTVYVLTAPAARGFSSPAHADHPPRIATVREDGKGVLSYHFDGDNSPISALALRLAAIVHAPVLDQTHLTGNYDFRIDFAYDSAFGGLEADPDVPTIFTALQSQVGLKLVADKGPIEVHVIRRATKPSPN